MSAARSKLFLVTILAVGCGGPQFDAETAKHVLAVDEYGRLLDTQTEGSPPTYPIQRKVVDEADKPSAKTSEALIEEMVKGIVEGTSWHLANGGRRKVVIFAHGGLNSWDASSETILKVKKRILGDKDPPAEPRFDPYPIFVQWNSEPFDCLNEHIWWIRHGRVRNDFWLVAAPLYFVGDLGRGFFETPVAWFTEIENTFGTAPSMKRNAEARYVAYQADPVDGPRFSHGEDHDRGWRRYWLDEPCRWFFLPLRAFPIPLLTGFGEPAWENMIRRTRMLFHTEREFEIHDGRLPEGSGAMAIFLRRLEKAVGENGGPEKWDITLVGHSMGAMVCAETLRIAPCLPVRNIVFMAAACSVREYRDSVLPFLEAPEHTDAQMHHLVLSDWAEEHEMWLSPWLEIVPRGSLLVWIDSFLSSPATLLDRTAGRYVNLMAAAHLDDLLDPSVRRRITVLQFDSGPNQAPHSPQGHGEFVENVDFWRSASWDPKGNRVESPP